MANQICQIDSGNFSSGEGKKGNFSAYTAEHGRIFIHKNQMNQLGFNTDKDLTFPLFAIIKENEIQTRDADGELTDVIAKRLQAVSIFKTEDAALDAFTSSERLAIKAKAKVHAVAKASGLTESMMNSVLAVA